MKILYTCDCGRITDPKDGKIIAKLDVNPEWLSDRYGYEILLRFQKDSCGVKRHETEDI